MAVFHASRETMVQQRGPGSIVADGDGAVGFCENFVFGSIMACRDKMGRLRHEEARARIIRQLG